MIGFLSDAKFVNTEANKNAHWTKNMTLKFLAKSSTKPIEATLTDVYYPLS